MISEPHYIKTIEKYSDYNAHDPYWISLYRNIENSDLRQRISDALNQFFKKHGPDANEDYAGCCGPLMRYSTAKNALEYAFKKCRKLLSGLDIDPVDCIDGGFSMESDGREIDPCTGELLHAIPINEDSVLDEIEYLIDYDKLSKDDWVWLYFVVNSFRESNSEINAKLRQLTRKHR